MDTDATSTVSFIKMPKANLEQWAGHDKVICFRFTRRYWRHMTLVIAEQFLKGLVTSGRCIEISNVF
jgi:hypothetical protein